MKPLFLDFDGVLNSEQESLYRWRQRKNRKFFKSEHVWGSHAILDILRKITPVGWHSQLVNIWLYYCTSHCRFDPIACSNLQYILDEDPEVRIVVSSMWRHWGMFWLKKILKRNGIDVSKVIGRTGAWQDGGQERGDQIKSWLDRHESNTWPPKSDRFSYMVDSFRESLITAFVVLDDDGDMSAVKENFVQTHSSVGLTIVDARKALKILANKH